MLMFGGSNNKKKFYIEKAIAIVNVSGTAKIAFNKIWTQHLDQMKTTNECNNKTNWIDAVFNAIYKWY